MLLLFGMDLISFAEEKPHNLVDNIKQFQQKIEDTSDIMKTIKNQEEEQQEKSLGITPEIAFILNNLKDPFIPKLPQPAPSPEPLPMPTPEPPHVVVPPPPPPPSPPELKISGLIWNTNKPQAIVNGQIVAKGDVVQEWIITSISKNGIEIKNGDQIVLIPQKQKLTLEPSKNNPALPVKSAPASPRSSAPGQQTQQRRSISQSPRTR